MPKKTFNEEEIYAALMQFDNGTHVQSICEDLGISQGTFYNWRSRYGKMDIETLKRFKEMETANRVLRTQLTNTILENKALKDVLSKKW